MIVVLLDWVDGVKGFATVFLNIGLDVIMSEGNYSALRPG
jgi:hypothetical protein